MTIKCATLNKIRKKGDNNLLKLKCHWDADELYILIVDGNTAWRGKYSTKEIKTFCEDIGITTEEYINECQNAFSNTDTKGKFSFVLENDIFMWKKEVDTDITVKFGCIKLSTVPLTETLHKLLDFAFEEIEYYQKEAHDAKKKQQYYEEVRTELVSKLKKHEEEKTKMENILYSKFLSLLNTKKERIKHLEQEISELSSNTEKKTIDQENQESEESDTAEQTMKTQIKTKKISQARKRNKKVLQPMAQTSTAVNHEFHGMSETQPECSGISTPHFKGKELLIPKRNIGKKGRYNRNTSNNENSNSAFQNEVIEVVNDNPLTVPEFQPNNFEDFLSDKPNTNYDKNTTVFNVLNPRAGPSNVSFSTASECSQAVKNDATSSTKCSILNEHSKLEPLETSPIKLHTHMENKIESIHTKSQVKSNVLSKVSDVICPIDLVSGKINTQSNIRQNNKSINNISGGKKKDQSSPGKQRKDFEIISPLDLLNTTAYSPPRKRSVIGSEPATTPKKNCLESTLKPTNNQDYKASAIKENMKTGNEPSLENIYDMDTQCEDSLDTGQETIYGIKLIKSKSEVEANHYDSETDVDEPEYSSQSPDCSKSASSTEEDKYPITTLSALKNKPHSESRDTHQPKLINNSKNLLNDSLDSDNSSLEILEPALPKRTHRSKRIKKCVPLDNKNINHFTRLGQLEEKSENTACTVQAPIYNQDTQIVDTQKLLDEL